jgi:hypothetical protein
MVCRFPAPRQQYIGLSVSRRDFSVEGLLEFYGVLAVVLAKIAFQDLRLENITRLCEKAVVSLTRKSSVEFN